MINRLAQLNGQFASKNTGLTDAQFEKKFENIQVKILENSTIMFIQLNRPKQLNALNDELYTEMLNSIAMADADPNIKCIILTGSEKAFAAGADIK